MWQQGVGGPTLRRGLPLKMQRLRPPDHDRTEASGKKCERDRAGGVIQAIARHEISWRSNSVKVSENAYPANL